VGRRIGELRRARGLKQQDLADRIRATAIYVAHVEGGDENLTIASLVRFAEVGLGVEVAELFRPPATTQAKRGRPRRTPHED
jgi:transcriptional regulator with XRE-family HTH domain